MSQIELINMTTRNGVVLGGVILHAEVDSYGFLEPTHLVCLWYENADEDNEGDLHVVDQFDVDSIETATLASMLGYPDEYTLVDSAMELAGLGLDTHFGADEEYDPREMAEWLDYDPDC